MSCLFWAFVGMAEDRAGGGWSVSGAVGVWRLGSLMGLSDTQQAFPATPPHTQKAEAGVTGHTPALKSFS